MFIKPRKASTDPILRSLLQKAVRRGASRTVELVSRALVDLGDTTWLRSRAVVILFEEAWPLARSFSLGKDPESKIAALLRTSRSSKNKDAAGLGALAFALHEGDTSVFDFVPDRQSVRIVAAALERPPAFFEWALKTSATDAANAVVLAAKQYLAAATWGWDKATILAGAYLAASSGVPALESGPEQHDPFPLWVALDKHTPEGKDAIRRVGHALHESYRNLIWAGFYFESARVNRLESSPWFDAERNWRLDRAGMSLQEARSLWHRVSPSLEVELAPDVEKLEARLSRVLLTNPTLFNP